MVRIADRVVQLLGGVGEPRVQLQATRLVEQFALRTGATPQFFHAPGIVGSEAARDALLADPYIGEATAAWEALTLAVVGIGSVQPSPLLRESGNAIPLEVVDTLQAMGAVGDICLRFFDRNGDLVDSDVNRRVLGISVPSFLAVPRKIGVAGGSRKYDAIRAAVKGHWIDVLITDAATAQRLIEDQG
ncbi:MAG: sugar-binding transcriptional regulator [Actinomycetales bacterium]|nr:sugar-binding domain-containing protein [Leifsonia sp.]